MRQRCARLVVLAIGLLVGGSAASARVVQPFPSDFRWGTAISGFQSEMGVGAPADPTTDWWVWVRDAANVSSGRVSGELPESGPGFYDLFARDAVLARKGLGNDALRLGIEWSRIFPTSTAGIDASGGFTPAVLAALDAIADPIEVAHYREVFAALRRRGLEPMVTLNHFSLPLWLHDPIAVRDAFAGVESAHRRRAARSRAGGLARPRHRRRVREVRRIRRLEVRRPGRSVVHDQRARRHPGERDGERARRRRELPARHLQLRRRAAGDPAARDGARARLRCAARHGRPRRGRRRHRGGGRRGAQHGRVRPQGPGQSPGRRRGGARRLPLQPGLPDGDHHGRVRRQPRR